MKLKELEGHLQQVTPFSEFDYMLEQYPTSPHLAARMLFTISSVYDDIEEKVVGDFGCGGGMLGLGAAMLGAGAVLGIDIDPKAIALARRNARELDLVEETDFFLVDMARWAAAREQAGAGEGGGRGGEAGRAGEDGGSGDAAGGAVDDGGAGAAAGPVVGDAPSPPRSPLPAPLDTVVMNPPFGTRHKGIDAVFLRHALRCVRQGGAVYSLHKSTTRAHLFAVGLQVRTHAAAAAACGCLRRLRRTAASARVDWIEPSSCGLLLCRPPPPAGLIIVRVRSAPPPLHSLARSPPPLARSPARPAGRSY